MDNPSKIVREEKILIFFSPRQTTQFEGRSAAAGDWIIAEPHKAVYAGQKLTWKAVGNCQTLELDLPNVFPEPRRIKVTGNTVSATLTADAPEGVYAYEAYCNDQLAVGGSSPVLILDP